MTANSKSVWTKTITIRRSPYKPGMDPEPEGNAQEIELWALWAIYEAVRHIGIDMAAELISIGMRLERGIQHAISMEEFHAIERMLQHFVGYEDGGLPSGSKADALLGFTHKLIEQEQITYSEAARFASDELEQSITADAWRMRMNRWAREQGLGRPYVRRGRPPGRKSEQASVG